jgi:CDP-paratose 2-epimerase
VDVNAVVTGGCGFVGCNLVAYLLELGWTVTVFDNLSREGATANLAWLRRLVTNQFIFQHGDVRNVFDIESLIARRKPDVIFHLAGQVAMTTSMESPRRDFEINVLGSINVLEAVRQHSPSTAIVYSSSNKVYGNLQLDLVETETRYTPRQLLHGIDENAKLEFQTPYGCSKGAADQYMLDYARSFDLKTVVFRHSTIYGGRQFATVDQGWVGWFCRKALELKNDPNAAPFTISGDGKQVRDLLHVNDAVRCYVAAFEAITKVRGEAFNIGGGVENSMSLLELFSFLEDQLAVKLRFQQLPWRQSDQKYFVADIAKATRSFKWSPEMGFRRGIESALAWEEQISQACQPQRM